MLDSQGIVLIRRNHREPRRPAQSVAHGYFHSLAARTRHVFDRRRTVQIRRQKWSTAWMQRLGRAGFSFAPIPPDTRTLRVLLGAHPNRGKRKTPEHTFTTSLISRSAHAHSRLTLCSQPSALPPSLSLMLSRSHTLSHFSRGGSPLACPRTPKSAWHDHDGCLDGAHMAPRCL